MIYADLARRLAHLDLEAGDKSQKHKTWSSNWDYKFYMKESPSEKGLRYVDSLRQNCGLFDVIKITVPALKI